MCACVLFERSVCVLVLSGQLLTYLPLFKISVGISEAAKMQVLDEMRMRSMIFIDDGDKLQFLF